MSVYPHLNTLLNLILFRYVNESNCIIQISQNETDLYVREIPIVKLLADTNDFAENLEASLHFGCQIFVFHTESDSVYLVESAIQKTDQRFNRRKLIFILFDRNELLRLLDLHVFHFVPDVLFILTNTENFELLTHKFVGKSNQLHLQTLDFWDIEKEIFKLNADLFPDKLKNFEGRPLKMSTFTYLPYVVLDLEREIYDGTEMRIAMEYAKQINCTVEILDAADEAWGIIYENSTGEGVLGSLVEDKADIGFVALYTWFHEYGFLDLSFPVIRTGITCLTPKPGLLTSWKAPLFPFTNGVWFWIIAINLAIIIAMDCISRLNTTAIKLYSFWDCVFIILGMIVLQPFPGKAGSSAALNHLVVWVLVLAVLITCSYSSGLASSMTVPRFEASVKTLKDLAAFGLEWGANHEAWIFSLIDATDPVLVKIVNQFRTYPVTELTKRSRKKDFAFSIERLPFGNFAVGSYLTKESVDYLQLMTQDLYWEYCVFMMRKSSPHLEGLNALIGRMHAAGLMTLWEQQVTAMHSDIGVQKAVRASLLGQASSSANIVKLRTSHLKGLYVMWVFGCLLSLGCFIMELIWGKRQSRFSAM